MIDTSDFRNGLHIIQDGDIYTIVEFQHVKPGKGGAFVRTRLKNLRSGAVTEKTFRAGERMEQAVVERKEMEYLYNDGDELVLMDMETFDQVHINASLIGDQVKYMKENSPVTAVIHNGNVIDAEIPFFVELEVVETTANMKGDTASGGSKPATLETGAVVGVPFFINVGDKVKVDTRTDSYLERVR
ncbi:MAG: elongation factor P [Armatimonadetes bacterium]|nr:elongation factor P [Armatimonadota bacterium]